LRTVVRVGSRREIRRTTNGDISITITTAIVRQNRSLPNNDRIVGERVDDEVFRVYERHVIVQARQLFGQHVQSFGRFLAQHFANLHSRTNAGSTVKTDTKNSRRLTNRQSSAIDGL
jgi:hypothetical protein